ncbi:matrixin family metalloprotease [Streptomyces sp. NBC_00133]|uniref:matrixin family metalloprotease n=1 Tax=Streptomyces sp. NBC_00133 TaxID=2903624 RepID=UPI00324AD529
MPDVPVPGDYDGDGTLDTAFWVTPGGNWFIQPHSGGQQRVVQFGQDGDIPVPSDFDHDGKADLAVWRPGDRMLRVRPSSGVPDWALPIPQDGEVPRPEDHDALTLFAYALFALALRLKAAGRPDEAFTAAREGVRIFLRLARSPGKLDPAVFLSQVVELAGHLPAPEAVTPTQDAVAILRRLVDTDPSNLDHQTQLAFAYFWLTLRLEAAGRPDEAFTAAREGVRIFLRLAGSPGNLNLASFLARVVELTGHLPASEAVAPTQDAVAILRRLVDTDPSNLDHQTQLAFAYFWLTLRLEAAGRPDEAFTAAREGVRIFLRLAGSPGNLNLASFLARVVELTGHLPASEAVTPTQDAVAILRRLVDTDPTNLDHQTQLASTLHSLTTRLQDAGRPDEAATAGSEAEAADHRVAALRRVPSVLERLGYGGAGGTAIMDLLQRYGTVWSLPLDGRTFDNQLVTVADHLDGRFCGVPDHVEGYGALGLHPLTFFPSDGQWTRGNLTWSLNSVGAKVLKADTVEGIIASAFAQWEAVLASQFFKFRKVESGGDLRLRFVGKEIVEDFGEDLGTIGAAKDPPEGDINFDAAELWDKARFLHVALHEIGHALGLGHTTSPESLMAPKTAPGEWHKTIDVESKRELSSLYDWTDQLPAVGGTADRPSLAVAGATSSTSFPDQLFMAWRGSDAGPDDRSLWCSELVKEHVWGPQKITRFASTHGPALTSLPPTGGAQGLMMAWKGSKDGSEDDKKIWFATKLPSDPDWGNQSPVPGVLTSCGPALASFNDRIFMAWKGFDNGSIWFSSHGPGGWAGQQEIRPGEIGTSHSPCLVAFRKRLFLFWKGTDTNVFFSSMGSAPGSTWLAQQPVQYAVEIDPTPLLIGSSHGPAATVHDDLIALAWKGATDGGLWFTWFDGKDFAGQIPIPHRGTSAGPAIAQWNGRLHMTWKGSAPDTTTIFESSLG